MTDTRPRSALEGTDSAELPLRGGGRQLWHLNGGEGDELLDLREEVRRTASACADLEMDLHRLVLPVFLLFGMCCTCLIIADKK